MNSRKITSELPWFLRSVDAAISFGKRHRIFFVEDPETRRWLESVLIKYLRYAESVFRAGSATLFRGIKVREVRKEYLVNFDCIGKSWSRYRHTAGVYDPSPNLRGKTRDVVITGIAPIESIDWENSLLWFLADFEEQWEVRLGTNKPILVTHVDGEELPLPIDANSGPEGLGNMSLGGSFMTWVDVCSLKNATRVKVPKRKVST